MVLKVLYEDNHIIAVYKPAGILVQPARFGGDKPGELSLMGEVKEYLREKYKKPGNVFLGLVHRIDRPVSGIVLFAKTSKGASRLSEQFRNNEIDKTYYAVVEGKLEQKNGKLIHYLKKDEEKRIASVSETALEDYDKSELEYEVVKSNKEYSLIKINLITGRFHQIRAQFSHIGHPIAGDSKYGSIEKMEDGSIALCAVEVEFKTATTNEVKNIKIDYPESWSKFFS